MSLYAIGDLHLHFQSELKAPGLVGDHSWGKNLEQAETDLQYICDLPGRKILIRGNHDMFWDANKTASLNARYAGKLEFLQGNYYTYRDYALVGTKGFTFEGPLRVDRRGRIVDWDDAAEEHAKKIVERELKRLRDSFEAASRDGYRKFIMFLHYPPTSVIEEESGFTRMAEEYGVEQVIYAHCHGEARFHDSIEGLFHDIRYSLVSGDFLKWRPYKVLD